MEVIVELLVQFVFEVLGEVLVEVGFRGAANVLRSRVGRFVVAALAGFGGGLWWGARLTAKGRTQEPRALWVSLVLAAVFCVVGLVRQAQHESDDQASDPASVLVPPWRWPVYRLVGFGVLNAAIAIGVFVGFRPHGG